MWEGEKKTQCTIQDEKIFQEQNTNIVIPDSPQLLHIHFPPLRELLTTSYIVLCHLLEGIQLLFQS